MTRSKTPATDSLRWFLDAAEGKILTRSENEMLDLLIERARTEQRLATLSA